MLVCKKNFKQSSLKKKKKKKKKFEIVKYALNL